MFYYLKGRAAHLAPNLAVIDCGGVGYACRTTSYTLSGLQMGQEVTLYTHLNVREDAMELYGFGTEKERNCFQLLIGVSGVGPKAALSILSATTPEGLATAIITGDEKALTVAQGLGKQIAQRILLELKDKLDLQEAFDTKTMHVQEASQAETGDLVDAKKEAVQALTALGYSGSEALRAVKQVDVSPDMNVEEILKQALKKMNF